MPNRRFWLLTTALLGTTYVATYCSTVEAANSGIYRTVQGRWPKLAVYAIGNDVTLGKVRRYSLDRFTHRFFYPLNQLDRQFRRSYWLESTDWWNV